MSDDWKPRQVYFKIGCAIGSATEHTGQAECPGDAHAQDAIEALERVKEQADEAIATLEGP